MPKASYLIVIVIVYTQHTMCTTYTCIHTCWIEQTTNYISLISRTSKSA